MHREQPGWVPAWEGEFIGWSKNFIRKNHWRVDVIHSPADLLQDAYLTFLRVKERYPRVTEPKHFMALFKTAMTNEMTDKARYRQKRLETVTPLSNEALDVLTDRIGEETNEGYLRVALSRVSPELRSALEVFNDPEKLKKLRQRKERTKIQKLAGVPAPRENLSMKLCRVAGVKEARDVISELRDSL